MISEPAIDEMAAALRSLTLCSVEMLASERRAKGSGPESTPPILVSQPAFPFRRGSVTRRLSNSMDAPIKVSPAHAAIPIALTAVLSCPRNSKIDAVVESPEAAKWIGNRPTF